MFLPSIVSSSQVPSENCVVGEWTRDFDWLCDGNNDFVIDKIHEDRTWMASSGSSGTWELTGVTFIYYYPNGTLYKGRVNSSCTAMEGTMTAFDGNTGCWSAKLNSAAQKRRSAKMDAKQQDSGEPLTDAATLK